MIFEKLADARLDAGWSSIQQAIHYLLPEPASAVELLHATYHSLSEIERKLYLYSPQLVARIDQEGQLHSALLFEPPRVPDHRQGLEEGLRALLTWLVSHDRVAEAQGWAQLSRVLMESLPDLDYLDKGAQASIFCVGAQTSRYYLNLQTLQRSSRLELLKQLDASELYNKVYPLSEHEKLSLGGVGIEILSKGYRTKIYIRGCLSALIQQAKRIIDEEELPQLAQIESRGFIREDMDAEMAIELDSSGALRTKWVYFVGGSELGVKCAEHWVSRGRHWERLRDLLTILGGDKSLFALGLEARAGDEWPRRINIYARKARDL